MAYGQILPRSVIDIAPLGTRERPRLPPAALRGAAPVQWAIANGETETGVTTMLIDEGLDTGPLLLARATPIGPEETAAELEPRLAGLGADRSSSRPSGPRAGDAHARPQDDARRRSPPSEKEEAGSTGRAPREGRPPGAGLPSLARGLTSTGRTLQDPARARAPAVGPARRRARSWQSIADGVVVACGTGSRLRLVEVQPESRRAMPAAAFAAGAGCAPARGWAERGLLPRVGGPRHAGALPPVAPPWGTSWQLPAAERLPPRSARFLHELVLGTLRRRGHLDHVLARLASRPLDRS